MDKFESQFADLDVQTSYMEDTMSSTTAVSTPQDQIDELMQRVAEEAQIELKQNGGLEGVGELAAPKAIGQEDDELANRLKLLRPAS